MRMRGCTNRGFVTWQLGHIEMRFRGSNRKEACFFDSSTAGASLSRGGFLWAKSSASLREHRHLREQKAPARTQGFFQQQLCWEQCFFELNKLEDNSWQSSWSPLYPYKALDRAKVVNRYA